MRGGEEREYFCMLYEARRHMPSELGCLLSQGSLFDRPVLAPSKPPKLHPFFPNQHPPPPLGLLGSSNGLGNCFGRAWTALCSCVCVFIRRGYSVI